MNATEDSMRAHWKQRQHAYAWPDSYDQQAGAYYPEQYAELRRIGNICLCARENGWLARGDIIPGNGYRVIFQKGAQELRGPERGTLPEAMRAAAELWQRREEETDCQPS